MTKDPQNKSDDSLNKLKIGIIGVSLRGRMLAEEAVNAAPGVRIGLAADTNSDLLAKFSRKYGCFQTVDYRELLDRPEIRGVIMGDGKRVRGFRGTDLAFHGRLPRKVWGHAPAIDKITESRYLYLVIETASSTSETGGCKGMTDDGRISRGMLSCCKPRKPAEQDFLFAVALRAFSGEAVRFFGAVRRQHAMLLPNAQPFPSVSSDAGGKFESGDEKLRRNASCDYVEEGLLKDTGNPFGSATSQIILGGDKFAERIRRKYLMNLNVTNPKGPRDLARLHGSFAFDKILSSRARHFKTDADVMLRKSSRCEASKGLMYLANKYCRGQMALTAIGRRMSIGQSGFVRSRIRFDEEPVKNRELALRLRKIEDELISIAGV